MTSANFEADFVSNVQSSAECAKDCYVYNCVEAHFIPVAAATNHTSRCLLYFSAKRGNCSESAKYTYHNTEQPSRITCVSCSKIKQTEYDLRSSSIRYVSKISVQNLAGYLAVRNKLQPAIGEAIATPPVLIEKTTIAELINFTYSKFIALVTLLLWKFIYSVLFRLIYQ